MTREALVIAFIPFPTSVISVNADHASTIFHALVMAAAGLALALLWYHAAYRHNLVDLHLSKQRRWREASGSLIVAAIFILSIGLGFIREGLVRICWVLIIPVSLLINVRREARE